jgi:hypothetical protein
MNKSLVLALAAAGVLLGSGAAHAANVSWSVGLSGPGIDTVISNGPVYQQPVRWAQPVPVFVREQVMAPVPVYVPAPVYAPAPVVYGPEPVYYEREPEYRPRHPMWRHHYRPVPVVEVVQHRPRWGREWQRAEAPRYHDDRRDHDDRHYRHD